MMRLKTMTNLKISDKSVDLEWNPWNPLDLPKDLPGNP